MNTNRRCARERISDDSVMQDAMMEMCDLCVFVLHAGASQMRLSHVVSVNLVARGCGNYRARGGGSCGFGGLGSENRSSSWPKLVCKLCKKTGQTVLHCLKHFDRNFTDEEKVVNNAEGQGTMLTQHGRQTWGHISRNQLTG
jgi:hypothetical protein